MPWQRRSGVANPNPSSQGNMGNPTARLQDCPGTAQISDPAASLVEAKPGLEDVQAIALPWPLIAAGLTVLGAWRHRAICHLHFLKGTRWLEETI